MSRFPRLPNAVRRPVAASAAAGMTIALAATGLALDTPAPGPATATTSSVSISDAAYTTTASQMRERRRHNPHGKTFARRRHDHVWFHGTVVDPDRRHHPVKIVLRHNGHRARVVRTQTGTHHFGIHVHLFYGHNKFAVYARNIGPGTYRSHLRTRYFRLHRSWGDRYHGHKRIAAHLLRRHGWGHRQMRPLISLWNRESGWRTTAANSSGAYGIPQALPGSKMSSAGPNWRYNPHTQIRWGLRYIAHRYGSPSGAWAHSQATGWY